MKLKNLLLYPLGLAMLMASCRKDDSQQVAASQQLNGNFSLSNIGSSFTSTQTFDEGFEAATKTAYADASVTFASGSWDLNLALVGTSTSDAKVGSHSIRIETTGSLGMNFDVTTGASTVTIQHAVYGSDASSTWGLWMSTNGGSTYTQVGSTITTSSTTLSTATFTPNVSGNVRFQIRKATGSGRINIDEFTVNSYSSGSGGGGTTGDNSNMLLGNPSGATTSITTSYDNYLYDHGYYIQSYNRDKGEPNWTCWHIGTADLGSIDRSNDFRPDSLLPAGWYEVPATAYSGSGFDRGHNCPSGDRTATLVANQATFLMDNMVPQAPNNNEQTWGNFEAYCRTLVTTDGDEVYVIMGSYGSGGTGSGSTLTTVDGGKVVVPSNIWKVAVVIPAGNNDLSRITSTTRVISINTPNINTINSDWTKYIVTAKSIETATGYSFFTALPSSVKTALENELDSGN
jgi:endonuclease G